MDRTTVFTKTAKGLMEATGKTSHLSRDIRAVLKEVDGRATVELLQARLGKISEAKLQEALETLTKGDFVREFSSAASSVASTTARTAPAPSKAPATGGDEDLDFTTAIPTTPTANKQAEEAAKQKARAAAEARAKAEAAARAKAAAEAAARAKAEAEAKARAEAAARAKAEAEAKARAEAAARAKAEAEARARREAEERARKEAEEKARREADELRAKLEQERKAREEAERRAKEEAERERKAAEEKARREADELRAKLEEERKAREEAERKAKEEAERRAREEAERKAKEEAERARREAEDEARREAEARARQEAEEAQRAREEAERKAQEEAEHARLEAEERAKSEAGDRTRREAEESARREAEERARREAEERARREAEEQARRQAEERAQAEEKARLEAEAAERRQRAEAEERAKQEAETQARKQAEEADRRARDEAERKTREDAERARRETEERAAAQPPLPADAALEDLVKIETDFDAVLKAGVSAPPETAKRSGGPDDLLRKATEELERRQAEEQAAAEQARAKAQAEAKQAEEEARRKDEAQAQQAPKPAAAKPQLPEYVDAHAEAQALLEAQNAETERHFADMEKELDAEQAAAPARVETPEPSPERKKKEAKESARAAAAEAAAQAREAELEFEPAPERYRARINWGKPVALGLFALLVAGLVLVNFISFDGSIPQFEKLASAYLQQPVKIKALHLSLVPRPHWRLDGVSVGNEGQLKAAQVNAVAELGSMFSDKKAFSSIELESPVLGEQGLLGLLFGKPAGRDFKVASIVAKNAKLESKTIILPALDAKISMDADGAWQKIALETPDHKTSLTLKPDSDGATLEVETNVFSLPFHPSFMLENFVASGQIRRGGLTLKEFKGGIFDGYLSGNANLKWGTDWSLDGDISVRAMDPGKFVPALLDQGRLEGKAAYSMRAKSYDELFDAPRLEGSFDILKGNLLGVDLGRMLQGGGVGGRTAYAELTGSFLRESGRIQLRQLNLASGPVSASGSAEVDAGKRINGRLAVELKSPVAHARANLTLSGTLQDPHFTR